MKNYVITLYQSMDPKLSARIGICYCFPTPTDSRKLFLKMYLRLGDIEAKHATTSTYVLTMACIIPIPMTFLITIFRARALAHRQILEADIEFEKSNPFKERIAVVYEAYDKVVLHEMIVFLTTLVMYAITVYVCTVSIWR